MKDRDVEDPAKAGHSFPDDNGLPGLEPETSGSEELGDDNNATHHVDLPRRADLSKPNQARRLRFGRPSGRSEDRTAPERPLPAEPARPSESTSRLQEYVRTRGVRGRSPSQAHQVGSPAADGGPSRVVGDGTQSEHQPARLSAPHPLSRRRNPEKPAAPAVRLPRLPSIRPSSITARRNAGGVGARPFSLRSVLRRPSLRTAFGATGIFATVAIVAALVIVLPSQKSAPQATGGSIYGVSWKAASQPPKVKFDFGPYFTNSGPNLLMLGTTGSSTTVWASVDGATWSQISDSGAFEMSGRRFVAQGMSDDGNGGLVVVGNSVGSGATDVMATAWHSQDGHSWSQAQVQAGKGQEMIGGVAALPGAIVAAGNGVAWYSADGSTWIPVGMPAAQAFIPRAVGSWGGGFAIVALAGGSSTIRSAVWYSTTGRSWTQSPSVLEGFDARGIAGLGHRIVVVGSDTSDTAEGLAVSWASSDGNKWTKATAPSTQATAAMDGVTAIDGSFVAVGAPDSGVNGGAAAADTSSPSQSAASLATWVSEDGLNWLSMTTPTVPVSRGHLSSIGGKVVLAGSGKDGVAVLQGTVTLGARRVARASATPAIVYSLDLTAGSVPMIPDVTATDSLGPVVATSDRFVAFTTGGAGSSVWTSTDGGHLWAQEAKPSALVTATNNGRPVVLEAIADGKGGVLAIGSVTDANGSNGTIWHRTANAWHQATIQDDAPPEFSSIAAGSAGYVASSDKAGGSAVMYSADGDTWYASTIAVGEGFGLTVATYQYGFVAVGTNTARGGASAAWSSPDGRTWTLRPDWKLPPNVTALFGVGKYLVATSTVTPGAAPAPLASPAAGSPSASGAQASGSATTATRSPAKSPARSATPSAAPAATPGPPYTQWWWSATGAAWQQTSLQTSSTNYAIVNNEIFAIDPPAGGATDWTTWSSADGRTWLRPVSDPISFPGAKVCALAALGNNLVIVGWQESGQLKGYFGKLTSQ
jgi:hypothetical protein